MKRITSAIGIEIDPAFANTASKLWESFGLKVEQGDFTNVIAGDSCPPRPNLILANPPYVRHHHLPREKKDYLRSLTRKLAGVDVNGLAGLYIHFILLATAWMEEGGYAAWLIPSEFMDVNYGECLKKFLGERVTLIRAHRFSPDDVQFDDALVSSCVLVFRKSPPDPRHSPQFTYGGTLSHPHIRHLIPVEQLRQARKWTAYPRHANNDRLASIHDSGPTIGDYFRIQRGIATGDNRFFILDRADAMRRGFPSQYLRPILPSPRFLKTTRIDADTDGFPLIDRQLCVIDCDLPEHLVEERHPLLWEYLQMAVTGGIKEGYLVSRRSPWYRQEQRDPSLFLCTYMGRGTNERRPFRFILNRSQAIGTNLYLMLYPRDALATMLRAHPERLVDVHDFLMRITGDELRGQGRVYGGGLNKIEPGELARISCRELLEKWPVLAKGRLRGCYALWE